jgi:iron complex transport system substrate-binding protein
MLRVPRAALAVALVGLLVACGDDEVEPAGSSPAPTTVASAPAVDAPQRIVSLSPTHTEVLFAIGAADQVIAVDDQSTYPPEALDKPHDLSGFEPNVEAIAALDPDLVVISYDPNGLSEQLGRLGIEVWTGDAPVTFDDVYAQIEELGAKVGRIAEAARLVLRMQTDIDAAVASAGSADSPISYFHELDPTLYTVTSRTFIGSVYGLFGLVNIADEAEPGNDYPQLSAEFVVAADPHLVFLADSKCCGESADSVAARPGWDGIRAVAEGNVVMVDDDIASRWGPRLVDFVQQIAGAVVAAKVAAG